MKASRIAEKLRRFLPFIVTATAAVLATRKVDDMDTWWHLAGGRWIVENGRIPYTDPLSYTVPDNPWINLQWLFDVLLYGVHSLGGENAIVALATVCFSFGVWLLFVNTRTFVDDLTASVLVLWALLLAEERFMIRPEMFSFIFLGLVLRVLLTLRSTGGVYAWLLVPIMIAWVNFHALYIMGVVCIVCALAGAFVSRVPFLPSGWREASDIGDDGRRSLLKWAPAAVLATAVNPFFLEGMRFPLKLMTRIGGESAVFSSIGEFRSPWSGYFTTTSISAYQGLFIFGVAVVLLAAVADAFGRRRRKGEAVSLPGFDLGAAAMFAGLAYLSCLARRNLGIFAFGVPPILAMCLSGVWARVAAGTRANVARRTVWIAPIVLIVSIGFAFDAISNRYYQRDERSQEFGFGIFDANYPGEAVAFARDMNLPGPMYNDMSMGGYLTWDHPTGGGVFMDGRLEVYDTEFYSYYQSAYRQRGAWHAQAEKYGFQSVMLFHRWANRQGLIRLMLGDPDWTLVYHDPVGIIFVRRAGNEDIIARALAEFPKRQKKLLDTLAAPDPHLWSWQAPVSRLVALETYTRLLALIGRADDNVELYKMLLALGPDEGQEKRTRVSLGYQLARRGSTAEALMHLHRALEISPEDTGVQQLIERLGG